MNCTQIEELLPLYAGHDLAKSREQLVTTHLQSCPACSFAAAGYRDVRELMQDFVPPGFGDEVYAGIRKNVWQRIEKGSRPRSFFESMAVWFQPRLAWAAPAALLIIVSLAGLYFIIKEFNVRPTVLVSVPKWEVGPPRDMRDSVPLPAREAPPKQRQADMPKRQQKPDRMVAPDRGNSLVATGAQPSRLPIRASETLALQSPESPIIGTDKVDFGAGGTEKTLRMEIQTKDPNIRIIWFAPREPKPMTVNSKGT